MSYQMVAISGPSKRSNFLPWLKRQKKCLAAPGIVPNKKSSIFDAFIVHDYDMA